MLLRAGCVVGGLRTLGLLAALGLGIDQESSRATGGKEFVVIMMVDGEGGSDVSGFPMISFFPVGHGAHQLGQALRGVRLDSDTKLFFPRRRCWRRWLGAWVSGGEYCAGRDFLPPARFQGTPVSIPTPAKRLVVDITSK